MKKAQTSIEWLFAIGTIFLIFLLILGFSFDKKFEVVKTERYTALRDECLKLSEMIMSTFLSGDGTRIQTELSYNATIYSDKRLIEIIDKEFVTCTIPLNQVEDETLESGIVILTNIEDFVNLQNG